MATVTQGGVTSASKNAKAAGPKLGDPDALRALVSDADKPTNEVTFVGNADHLHLRPPKPLYDAQGNHIGMDPGVFIDFQGVGRTRSFNLDLADEALYVKNVRELIEQKPAHPDVHRLKIRELKDDAPAPPFVRWDEFSADHIKIWLTANLSGDHERNARLVQECARYEAANGNRDDVLAVLAGMLASEASVTDAFDVEIRLK